MSFPFFDQEIFRVDEDARREAARKEVERLIRNAISIEQLQGDLPVEDQVPLITSFPLSHKTRSFSAGEGEVLMIKVSVPQHKIGFLQAIGTTYLLDSPNSYFKILIDDIPITGLSEADGRITRQIGDLLQPRSLIPPLIFYKKAEFWASNFGNSSTATLGYTLEGVLMNKPKFVSAGAIVTEDDVVRLVRENTDQGA